MSNTGHRLAFLIVESEPSQGLSTRKLLLESAKHNVVTAYSSEEGIRMFKRFPRVDAVVIDSELKGKERLATAVKEENPKIRVVCLCPCEGAEESWADETVNSHDPAALLKLLEEMGGRTDI
jgi:DNA-binding response OmpR family regulator